MAKSNVKYETNVQRHGRHVHDRRLLQSPRIRSWLSTSSPTMGCTPMQHMGVDREVSDRAIVRRAARERRRRVCQAREPIHFAGCSPGAAHDGYALWHFHGRATCFVDIRAPPQMGTVKRSPWRLHVQAQDVDATIWGGTTRKGTILYSNSPELEKLWMPLDTSVVSSGFLRWDSVGRGARGVEQDRAEVPQHMSKQFDSKAPSKHKAPPNTSSPILEVLTSSVQAYTKYTNNAGRVCTQGTSELKGTQAYPPGFGAAVANLFFSMSVLRGP